jgi:hypothetical protein
VASFALAAAFAISRHALLRGGFLFRSTSQNIIASPLLELASVFVCLDHVATGIVNANHSMM